MMWGLYDGNWLWMGAAMLLFWAGVIALVIWSVKAFASPRPATDPAIETLRQRLAAGEISQEDIDKTKRMLQN
ncbi:MAG: hypothetical protein E6I27_01630 [Chloroflexi bacterium]|nr:MAG: hypothetical protein E6I27_01630 [Chloroflexota bacterium]